MTGAETFDLWWLIPIIMIVLCLFCSRGCCFVRRDYRARDQRGPPDAALRILARHYASGEIDDEKYRQRKDNIFQNEEGATL